MKGARIIGSLVGLAFIVAATACASTGAPAPSPQAPPANPTAVPATAAPAAPTTAAPAAAPATAAPAAATATAQPTSAPQPAKRGTLNYNVYWGGSVINGIYEEDDDYAWFFDSLIRLKYDGTFTPRLAESWESNADGTVWTFHLRKNVVWHDGKPFSADDVVFTATKIEDAQISSPELSRLQVGDKNVTVEKVDDSTVKFTLPSAYGPFLVNLSRVYIMPKHALEGVADMQTADFNKHPIGTGPFKVVEMVPDDHWTLVANDAFYLGAPKLAGVNIRLTTDTDAIVAALKTGEQDAGESEQISDLDYFKQKASDYAIYTTTPGGITYLWLNVVKEPLFQDARVRQAIAYAIDRQAIVDNVTYGYAKVVNSPIASKGITQWASDPDVPTYAFDPSKAADLLKQAGWTEKNAQGILVKDGKPFQFTVLAQSGYATYTNTLTAIQADLKKIGIDMQIQQQEPSAFRQSRRDSKRADKLQALLTGTSVPFDPDELRNIYYSKAYPQGGNFFGYANSNVDTLLDQAVATTDQKARQPLYYQIQKQVMQDMPYVPIYYYWIGWIVSNRLHGLPTPEQLSGVDPTYYIGWYGEQLSVDQ